MCEANYGVSAGAVGHRAHCSKCDSVFRVTELIPANHKNPYLPTEEDILRWLSEDRDRDDLPVRPRIVDGATAKAVVENDNIAGKEKILEVRSERIPSSLSSRLPNLQTNVPANQMKFRQTG